ncbi:MAG: DNA-directed polymerase [Myxococcaceae bacterium]|jgi:DNA polymerase-4|nr:DNA-directed polymerase [Myxococcaceae bacterium]
MKTILHVDMDAFYASVEELDDPSLRGRPLIVGGSARRGVVLAANYAARPFGARSAMPMAQAMRLCPQATVVPPRHARYAEVSTQVFEVFSRFTPLVEGLSLDEAFIDVTNSRSLFGDGRTIATLIKRAIKEEIGLTASAGVAPSKFVAKVASDLEKPDGLVVVEEDAVRAFLAPLPIERMWGVGPKTAPRLHEMGLHTIGDLATTDPGTLDRLLGSWGEHIQSLARGHDPRDVEPDREAKSVGAEITYDRDLTDRPAIERTLLAHAGRVAQRLMKEKIAARGVTVKIKYSDFVVRTRQVKLPEPVADTDSIFAAARDLFAKLPLERGVRLTGVSTFDLVDAEIPVTLFPDPVAAQRRKVEGLVASIHDRFGDAGLRRASLIDDPSADEDLARPPKIR